MHMNSTDKYVSIDTDKFSFFLPINSIITISLNKTEGANIATLFIATHISHGGGFGWSDMSYEFALKTYSYIISQINDNDFIDLNCDGTRIFIRQSEITGISYDDAPGNTKKEIVLYRKNNTSGDVYPLKQSGKDIKPFYKDLLAQISYAPRKNKSVEPRQLGKMNGGIMINGGIMNAGMWNQNQTKNGNDLVKCCNK